ncbi:MnmC family methyltransferase [Sphingomonas sp. BT-65]|uniref:spermidine synthase n=1 Tax=Sphingomonas sp. BT-65 TaxID=2989821 RepID=UPI002235B453|nr:MnmC family methyltransferase [Sphingomonas sp. BT-65]MCW4462219.1 MnmC family methyltransferase [Sphingomonas sp. BT-65]
MTPRELIGVAEVPGGEPLRLFRRGGDFMIVLDRNELMSSRMSGSEEALAELTLARLKAPKEARLLIGGYGMGFTLRRALALLGPAGKAVVAELVPGIIDWARGPMAELAAGCLDDPRTEVMIGDVGAVIAQGRGEYDAILLDVDNGPDGLTRLANDRLYTFDGLRAAQAALKPGGILAVWSAAPDDRFRRRMGEAGFAVEEVAVRARSNGKGPRHVIWFGRK